MLLWRTRFLPPRSWSSWAGHTLRMSKRHLQGELNRDLRGCLMQLHVRNGDWSRDPEDKWMALGGLASDGPHVFDKILAWVAPAPVVILLGEGSHVAVIQPTVSVLQKLYRFVSWGNRGGEHRRLYTYWWPLFILNLDKTGSSRGQERGVELGGRSICSRRYGRRARSWQ